MPGVFRVSIILFVSVSAVSVLGSTVVPGGSVSGAWTAAGSPYLVEGDLTIDSESVLTISSGVEVNFQGHYGLSVAGALLAEGAPQDSVVFTAADHETGWKGIYVEASAAPSLLDHCVVLFGTGSESGMFGGAVYCKSPHLTLSHCRFSFNRATCGGAIYVLIGEGPVAISDCTISANTAVYSGGGVSLGEMRAEMTDCVIEYNRVTGNFDYQKSGAGIYCFGFFAGSVDFSGCVFRRNHAAYNGGGLCVEGGLADGASITDCDFIENHCEHGSGSGIHLSGMQAEVTVSGCSFTGNWMFSTTGCTGGGLYSQGSGNLTLSHCTFGGNFSSEGGAAYCKGGTTVVEFCTFSHNHDNAYTYKGALALDGDATVTGTIIADQYTIFTGHPPLSGGINFLSGTHSVQHCDFHNNGDGLDFVGSVPAGLGDLVTVNANGDSCDVFSNIFRDPLLCDAPDDLTIAEISPCLGAGQAGADIGALGIGCELSPVPEDPPASVRLLGRNHPNPFNPSTSFDITVPRDGHVRVGVYDVGGRLVVTLVDESLVRGTRTIAWNGNDDSGRPVGSGVYLYRMQAADRIETRRMVLLK